MTSLMDSLEAGRGALLEVADANFDHLRLAFRHLLIGQRQPLAVIQRQHDVVERLGLQRQVSGVGAVGKTEGRIRVSSREALAFTRAASIGSPASSSTSPRICPSLRSKA
jgi:hypothetical protein